MNDYLVTAATANKVVHINTALADRAKSSAIVTKRKQRLDFEEEQVDYDDSTPSTSPHSERPTVPLEDVIHTHMLEDEDEQNVHILGDDEAESRGETEVVECNILILNLGWSREEVGFDKTSIQAMGSDWAALVEVFEHCSKLLEGVSKGKGAWQERRADQALVKLMQSWVDGTSKITVRTAEFVLPLDFFNLWQHHWGKKMFFPLDESSNEATIHNEIVKKKFWSGGREGLIVLAVGLRWSWWTIKAQNSQTMLDDWRGMVQTVTSVLQKTLDRAKR